MNATLWGNGEVMNTAIANSGDIIAKSLAALDEMRSEQSDGAWLEAITVAAGPHLRDWDIAECYSWGEWPARDTVFPGSGPQDIGIDAVAVRRSDGRHIAIQCKARQLDAAGRGADIRKDELDKFVAASANPFWAERWLVTNGDNRISDNARQSAANSDPARPVKLINIHADLMAQHSAAAPEPCPHCNADANADVDLNAAPDDAGADAIDGEPPRQTRQCMQDEAVAQSVRILREHALSGSGGLPVGQARGKIILPCGAGKTRVSLRIVEELTAAGQLSIVLCPSIALVAQLRREYLQHAAVDLRALAVCSDQTAGYDPKKESTRNTALEPTADNSNVSASEIKGLVTTDADAIAEWIRQGQGQASGSDNGPISVIFGTYQSGSRVADALAQAGVTAQVLVADEAHRTAGLRRKRAAKSKNGAVSDAEQRIRDFTLCHDNDAFPAVYRIYQTATPRVYNDETVRRQLPDDWIVRNMDDRAVFGVELYRKSYAEAVRNGWLADYRIIAVGVNDPDTYREANRLAEETGSKGSRKLTTNDYLRGLAFSLAMGGATQTGDDNSVPIASCIAFMNTVDHSRNMANDLATPAVQGWVQEWLDRNHPGQQVAPYTLEHLDAGSNVAQRENAKLQLADAHDAKPHGIINVGIFGEGTDAPALNAVAFLEPRRSPIDVIQAVGRAMRTAPGKTTGYIICPILIKPNANPEKWLSTEGPESGWRELGQILLALRAHDQRIEDNLSELLTLYIPKPPPVEHSLVAIAGGESQRIQYREHIGPPGSAPAAIDRVLHGASTLAAEFRPVVDRAAAPPTAPVPASAESESATAIAPETAPDVPRQSSVAPSIADGTPADGGYDATTAADPSGAAPAPLPDSEPTLIYSGKRHADGSSEVRMDSVARGKPGPDGAPGPFDLDRSKRKGRDMNNKGAGVRVDPNPPPRPPRPTRAERTESRMQQMLKLEDFSEWGEVIRMNLLAKSGLTGNRIVRDLNILETTVKEAARHLKDDGLDTTLDAHFGLDNLQPDKRKDQADGCTIAALLMMNAMMLHQRIANGRWLPGVRDLADIKNDTNVARTIERQWNDIISYDFKPILEPAVKVIYKVDSTGKLAGLERALGHLAAEAERIAETYADMGADHAGPLFNRVMGNQASDGAFFTRPTAAAIAARLTLDVAGAAAGAADAGDAGAVDWTDAAVWQDHKILDPACGSGTLLAALLSEMKRRARQQGATPQQLADLQKLAVEDTIRGLDINPISLQLAASQLTAGNQAIRYYRMGLHLMPYGPQPDNPAHIPAGSLELLGQQAIVPRPNALGLPDDRIASQTVWQTPNAELDLAVDAVKDARIVIMNPPFTNRSKLGEKFPKPIQEALRSRVDALERLLVRSDPALDDFVDKNNSSALFVALADKCLRNDDGVLTLVMPTVALCAPSGEGERRILAQRYRIHTVLTGRWPREFSLSQNVEIDESLIVATRNNDGAVPTRFIQLDRLPVDESEVDDLHQCLTDCAGGAIANGWGEVSYWPAERMIAGDWTPAIWRASELAQAAARFANDDSLQTLETAGLSPMATGRQLRGSYERAAAGHPGGFPILKAKSTDAQTRIQSQPDEVWIAKDYDDSDPQANSILDKAGYLLITAGQDSKTGRLTATADDQPYVGNGWMPVVGLSATEAKALAVFINSTPGRLQMMRHPGRKIPFPTYSAAEAARIRIPNVQNDARVRQILAECWEQTRELPVPQYREGECEVRRIWDGAVAEALGWDAGELGRLRGLLHQEPHVRGLGYGQYGDAVEGGDGDGADEAE